MDLFGKSFRKTLCIMGNGFDLAHGMATSWSDFQKWLLENGHSDLVYFWEAHIDGKANLWKDFEKSLGEYNLESLYEHCTEDIEFDDDHMMRTAFAIEDSPDFEVMPRKENLIESFSDWIDSIKISDEPLLIDLPIEARYLTFNYTGTLEKLYGIPESNILHIHGDVKNPIFGHGNYNSDYDDKSEPIYQITAKQKIIGEMNDLYKDVEGIISSHEDYFSSLSDVKEIIVRGHSYGVIDFPYFKKIQESVKDDCIWKLGWHNADDKIAAHSLMLSLNIHAELFHF